MTNTKILHFLVIALIALTPMFGFSKEKTEEASSPQDVTEIQEVDAETKDVSEADKAEDTENPPEVKEKDAPEDDAKKPVAKKQKKKKKAKAIKKKLEKKHTDKDKSAWVLGGGIIISPDYKDMMEIEYGSVDFSTLGWVDLQAGYRYQWTESFILFPALDLWVNYFVPEEEDTFLNTVLIPSLSIQYIFPNNPSYYAGVEVNYSVPNSGSDWMEPSATGPGFGGMIGYEMENEWNIEIGYVHLPIEVGTDENEAIEYNFGGFTLKCNRRF